MSHPSGLKFWPDREIVIQILARGPHPVGRNTFEFKYLNKKKHDNPSLFAYFKSIFKQLEGGDLMSSDKGFVSKGLILVWRTEKQPSGCA